jgi:hypothetical protein
MSALITWKLCPDVPLIALLSADHVLRGAAFDAPVTRIENGVHSTASADADGR